MNASSDFVSILELTTSSRKKKESASLERRGPGRKLRGALRVFCHGIVQTGGSFLRETREARGDDFSSTSCDQRAGVSLGDDTQVEHRID
jgi:hypothetical protein